MGLHSQPGVVTNITADELRDYMKHHGESEYQLVDVRERPEYRQHHIPGAQLIPLSEIESRQPQVRQLKGRNAVFYCRSGGRSLRAATWASQVVQLERVYNLVGGLSSWQGASLPEFPRFKAMDLSGGLDSLLHQALDIEKGTHALYELLLDQYAQGPVAVVVRALSEAEIAHARLVHGLLSATAESPLAGFEEMFDACPGKLVEGGESFVELVDRAKALAEEGDIALLEFALQIELSAYDLYKSLASMTTSEIAQGALLDLAQQEKRHSQQVLEAIASITP